MDSNSVVDYIKKTGGDTSPEGRATLYEKVGLGTSKDYLDAYSSGNNADINTRFLNKLRGGPSIVSTGDVHTEATKNSKALSDALLKMGNTAQNNTAVNPSNGNEPVETEASDPFITGLNNMASRADLATNRLIASTRAAYQNKINEVNAQYGDYKKGLQLLGIQENDAQSTPDLLAGHIQKIATEQMQKVDAYNAEEAKLIMDAQDAQANNDFKSLNEKMSYLKELRKEKANAIKEMYDNIAATDKLSDIQAHDIYDTLQTLGEEDKQTFIQEVAQRFNIPLLSLVTALADEKKAREAEDLDTANKKSILANRGKESSTTSSSGGTMKQIVANANKRWKVGATDPDTGNLIRGQDGFLDPQEYLNLYEQWEFGDKQFLANFKPETYINPQSYNLLPESIRPKKSSSSRSSTG